MIRVIVVLATLLTSTPVFAANLVPTNDPRCAFHLQGEIEKGDAEQLRVISDANFGRLTICLDSPGGSLQSGMELYDVFMSAGVATYLRSDDRCESACAIAFLGGSSWGDFRHANRRMEPGAHLAFHAPLPSREAANRQADVGTVMSLSFDIVKMLLRDKSSLKFSDLFMMEFLLHVSEDTRPIETVREAAHAGIDIVTPNTLFDFTRDELANACALLFELNQEVFRNSVSAWDPYFNLEPDGE